MGPYVGELGERALLLGLADGDRADRVGGARARHPAGDQHGDVAGGDDLQLPGDHQALVEAVVDVLRPVVTPLL